MLTVHDAASMLLILEAALPPGTPEGGCWATAWLLRSSLTERLGQRPVFTAVPAAELLSVEHAERVVSLTGDAGPDLVMLEAAEARRAVTGHSTASWRYTAEDGWVLYLVRWS